MNFFNYFFVYVDEASGSTADYFYEKLGIKCTFGTELRDTGRYGFVLPEKFVILRFIFHILSF